MQAVGAHGEEAELGKWLQIGQLGLEILGNRYAELALLELEIERKAAHQVLNNAAAQNIVAVELVAAHNRQAAGIDGGLIVFDIALVLRISAADFAYALHADGH